MMKYLLVVLIFFTAKANAASEYFSSLLQSNPRINFIVYKDQVILQNLLEQRYVYTTPTDGVYLLENGQKITVKNSIILRAEEIDYDQFFSLGISSGSFFNQDSRECNIAKFMIAQRILAMDCEIDFHQYQMLPLVSDFIRMIVISKSDLFNPKSCEPNTANINSLLKIESQNYESIAQEKNLQIEKMAQEQQGQKTNKTDKDIKKEQKKINQLRPWEFGLNDRSVILNSIANDAKLNGDLMTFYITYANDIGCIPYEKMKLLSCNEYLAAKDLFFEKYVGVSDVGSDDKIFKTVAEIDKSAIVNYTPIKLDEWGYEMSNCQLKEQVKKN